MAADHQQEPDHQPPAPADRLDGGQQLPVEIAPATTADHQQAPDRQPTGGQALASTVLAWCARQNIRPGALAVLLAVAAGCDSVAEVVAHTELPLTTVRTGLRRCTGRGRWHGGRVICGTGAALIATRPHPHAQGNGALQLLTTPAGALLAKALLGDAIASAELKGPAT